MKKVKLLAPLLCALMFIACKDDKVEVNYKPYKLEAGSTVKWKGTVVGGPSNEGTISASGGGFYVADEMVIGGEVNISVASIAVTNNLPAEAKIELINHLKTADFFNLAMHPTVSYTVVSTEKLPTPDAAGNNYKIYGSMKLLGSTFPLNIPAKMTLGDDKITVKSAFKFDRSKWGMNFAVLTPAPNGDLIEKDVEVIIDLVAEKEK